MGTPGVHRALGGREAEGLHLGGRAVPAVRHHPRHQVPQAQLRRHRPRHRRQAHPETLPGENFILHEHWFMYLKVKHLSQFLPSCIICFSLSLGGGRRVLRGLPVLDGRDLRRGDCDAGSGPRRGPRPHGALRPPLPPRLAPSPPRRPRHGQDGPLGGTGNLMSRPEKRVRETLCSFNHCRTGLS